MPAHDPTAMPTEPRNDAALAGTKKDADVGPFVLNLCPVAEPLAIPQPRASGLNRFMFFCSRGWEGNVEQCWLHMGYFATRAEAEKWLTVLVRLYPHAFVSRAEVTFAPEHHATLHMARRRERLP
jgi:hypothetical protein